MQTCTVADLDFKVKFELTAGYNDHVHAFLGYFDTVFSHSHKPLVLPTVRRHSLPFRLPPAPLSALSSHLSALSSSSKGAGAHEHALEADGLLPARAADRH